LNGLLAVIDMDFYRTKLRSSKFAMEPVSMCSVRQATGRVLVLGGGGAKGAYAFGCLKALRDREFAFDAISGASAGALNALAWSTGSFAEAEELWLRMSLETVYPFKFQYERMNRTLYGLRSQQQ
jgi:predicted acylesterase/phospholipase RssA